MAYKTGDRYQFEILPATIDDYVGKDDPVRAYDALIDALDFESLGIKDKRNQVGNPPYDPKTLLKILVYGYSYGWKSSRKLERALYHNMSFIWLACGLKPDHKTISNFRKDHKDALKATLKQSARICMELGLIEGNSLFVDGSKVRANASINQTKSKKRWKEILDSVEERIDRIMEECEQLDQEEEGSLVKLSEELKDNQTLREKVKALVERADQEGLSKINGTDPDCVNARSRQGSHACFNVQSTVDEKNGLIVNVDVVAENNDLQQFDNQIEQAADVLGKYPDTACGDSGYSNASLLKKTLEKDIDVIVPSARQITKEKTQKDEPFGKDKFRYDAENNHYICPEGQILRFSSRHVKKDYDVYRTKSPTCRNCPSWGVCTRNKRGREINRLIDEETRERLEARYETEEGKSIYKKRKEKVELPFGHIKRTLNGGAFLVRGLKAVNGEMAIFASCFNIARMITLLGGVGPMISKLRALTAC